MPRTTSTRKSAKHFNETETVNLTALIGLINTWNRIAISFRSQHPVRKAAA